MQGWPFQDPRNVAVFTRRGVAEGRAWIQMVTHDEEDGAWQFHPADAGAGEDDAAVVSLALIFALDPSIAELSDLPLGWRAWRERPGGPWRREPLPPEA